MEVFKFKNSTSDGEKIYQSGEMTLQYVSYSVDGPMTLRWPDNKSDFDLNENLEQQHLQTRLSKKDIHTYISYFL